MMVMKNVLDAKQAYSEKENEFRTKSLDFLKKCCFELKKDLMNGFSGPGNEFPFPILKNYKVTEDLYDDDNLRKSNMEFGVAFSIPTIIAHDIVKENKNLQRLFEKYEQLWKNPVTQEKIRDNADNYRHDEGYFHEFTYGLDQPRNKKVNQDIVNALDADEYAVFKTGLEIPLKEIGKPRFCRWNKTYDFPCSLELTMQFGQSNETSYLCANIDCCNDSICIATMSLSEIENQTPKEIADCFYDIISSRKLEQHENAGMNM